MASMFSVGLAVRPSGYSTFTHARTNFPRTSTWNNSGYAPPDPPRLLSHFRFDDPALAGDVLTAAVRRGSYLDALTHLRQTGLVSRSEQIHDGLFRRDGLWAVVVFDGRESGVVNLPYIGFGDARHDLRFPAPPVSPALFMSEMTETDPGLMSHEAAGVHAAALFLMANLTASVRL